MRSTLWYAALLGALVGCGGDATGPGGVTGSYTLTTVEGQTLPAVIGQGSTTTVTSGSLSLEVDGAYELHGRYDVIGGGSLEPTLNATGEYDVHGDSLILHALVLGDLRGAVLGARATVLIAGRMWEFRRE